MDTEWTSGSWRACQRYCEKLGLAEYKSQLAAHKKRGRRPSTLRYCPTQYQVSLCAELGHKGGEEAFKAIKSLQGYASTIGT